MRQDNSLFLHVYETAIRDLEYELWPSHNTSMLGLTATSWSRELLSYNESSLGHPASSERPFSYKLGRLKILYVLSEFDSFKDILVGVEPPVPLEKWEKMGNIMYVENSKFSEKYPDLIQFLPYAFVDRLVYPYGNRVLCRDQHAFEDMRRLSFLINAYRDRCEYVDPAIAAAFDVHLVKWLSSMLNGGSSGL